VAIAPDSRTSPPATDVWCVCGAATPRGVMTSRPWTRVVRSWPFRPRLAPGCGELVWPDCRMVPQQQPPSMLSRWQPGFPSPGHWRFHRMASSWQPPVFGARFNCGPLRSPDPRLLRVFEDTVLPVALSPDGRWLVAAHASTERLRQWDVLTVKNSAPGLSAAPAREAGVLRRWTDARSTASDGGLVRWDLAKVCEPIALGGHPDFVSALAFARDGSRCFRLVSIRPSGVGKRHRGPGATSARARAVGSRRLLHPDSSYLASVALTAVPGTKRREPRTAHGQLWDSPT